MNEKIIAQGAEAIIIKRGRYVLKNRIEKNYRHPKIDEKIRKLRTRAELKLLEKASKLINVPKVIESDEQKKIIVLEFIRGDKLADVLEQQKERNIICRKIGKSLAKLHDAGIIHGDLTTSNLILKNKDIYFIDFGLGFQSNKIEDKAVDLHLLKEALESKHPSIFEKSYISILKGYKSSVNYNKTIKQLEFVEKRGRYKAQY
ncbi:Kae1-associated serine/threonine protein kinase [Candidatus Pacearchaeota archaeon]|nr:Kae1-associated serine/threonine protein kinase [Candidatus Pacearchaeota archaeon]